ncbi:GNAT family N-acetyltransferase [Rhizobium multihospitium]|uniref:GNAT family N-acetyltransferase n=1 Tax=Rhizobium multihospitium TaxID=410764 RepID=UPI000B89FDF4|nr:GNAT family N-acetyltransferase [Rhizobium multihospitium]
MAYILAPVTTADDWRAMHDIRRAVLFTPDRHSASYDENHADDRLEGNTPFLLFDDRVPIGVVRLDQRGEVGIVRLVAIVKDKQRLGHGRRLNGLLEAEAKNRGIRLLRVNAAPDAVGFYLKAGWSQHDWDISELVGLARNAVQMEKMISD